MNIGPWWIDFRNPILVGHRPGKNWTCVNDSCPTALKPRRLSDDDGYGSCKHCHVGLRRFRYDRSEKISMADLRP